MNGFEPSSSSSSVAGNNARSDICIVGNGAVGKTAALALAQAGLRVSLLAPPAPAPDPAAVRPDWDVRVYALNHTARHLLSSVRVWEAMDAERIAPVDNMSVFGDGDGEGQRSKGQLSFDAYSARTDALAWIVEDRNLDAALNAALKFANVRQVRGKAVALRAGLDAAGLQLDSGEILSASLIVGADGGQSWVRGQCDIGLDYRAYGQRAIVTNFHCELPHHGIAHQWFSAQDGVIALLPLAGERVSLVWSAPDALADRLMQLPLAELAQRLQQYAGAVLGQLMPLQPEVAKAFPLALIKPHAMIAQRVALIGDAAHVVHPLAGHGMNLGFADVAALVKILSEREPQYDCGDSRVLRRYARARKEEVLLMQLATDGLSRLFASDAEPLRLARNLGMNLVNSLPVLKRRLIGHALGK